MFASALPPLTSSGINPLAGIINLLGSSFSSPQIFLHVPCGATRSTPSVSFTRFVKPTTTQYGIRILHDQHESCWRGFTFVRRLHNSSFAGPPSLYSDAYSRSVTCKMDTPMEWRVPKKTVLRGRDFYKSIGSPKKVLAPMVNQSEFVRQASAMVHSSANKTGLAPDHPHLSPSQRAHSR